MSTRLKLAKDELDRLFVFGKYENKVMKDMVYILGDDVPDSMARAIANFTMSSFIGHFHTKLELAPDNRVPLNTIGFILAKSGARKTSSVTRLEKTIQPGLDVINGWRDVKAQEFALRNDLPVPKLNPLSNALATEAGMIKRLNDFKKEGLGLPSMFVDEISTELATNQDLVPNIKLIAQLFDEGNMKSKPLKDSENQSDEVVGMGMSALFIGSEYGILEDEGILEKFNLEFISKLSRRCFFVYPEFEDGTEEVENIDILLEQIKKSKTESVDVQMEVGGLTQKIALALVKNDLNIIHMTEETERANEIYKIYCEEKSKLLAKEQLVLEQQHRHWKALKLAGVYALFNLHSKIQLEDLKEAIFAVESIADDLSRFLVKAERMSYEKLVDHFMEGQSSLNVHEVVKRKWIKHIRELDDLIRTANSKLRGIGKIEVIEEEIKYEEFKVTEGVACSYKVCTGTKDERRYKVKDGYKHSRAAFEGMAKILSNDTAYCAFEFRDGIRGRENIIGGCDFLVLDIDDTDISDTECSDFLADYNHIVCRTSDKANPYKYRIVLSTDIQINVTNEQWPMLMKNVASHIGMEIDILPKAQIFFGYADRNPIVNTDGEDFPVSELISSLREPEATIAKLPKEQLSKAWENRLQLFEWFYNSAQEGDPTAHGHTHNTLWMATRNMAERGLDFETSLAIMWDIHEFRDKKTRQGYLAELERRMRTYPEWQNELKQKNEVEEKEY